MRVLINNRYQLTPTSYEVTAQSFPTLYARFQAIEKQAGVRQKHRLIISDSDRISHNDDTITIGIGALNKTTWDDLEFAIAHEMGHAWREENPDRPYAVNAAKPQTLPKIQELEADIFARCLTDDTKRTIAALLKLGKPRDANHPPIAERVYAVQHATAEDCRAFSMHIEAKTKPFMQK